VTTSDSHPDTGPAARTLADLLDAHAARVGRTPSPEDLLEEFAAWAAERGWALYPAQEDALLELASGAHVILSTPTGSGKSLVAMGAMHIALAQGRRTYYTAPIKALVSEKFFDLCDVLGAQRVGMITGDAAVNPDAPVICATAEILANLALREGAVAGVDVVVMDEFHYYGDRDRGWAWQVPLIELTGAQFLLMSATLGDMRRIREDLVRRTGAPAAVITGGVRPVPLEFDYVLTPIHETIEALRDADRAPIYVVHPTQAAALERAQALMSINMCSREEKDRIAEAIGDFRFTAGFGRTLTRLVRHGVGVHHAGMLPRYRRLVEQLTRAGLLKVVCGTDTLGVGINVPIRTVLITSLVKFDGRRLRVLRAREFHQVAGRAGRPGFDTSGLVVVQAPEHEIENHRMLGKAGDDPKKRRKVVRKKPPEGPTWNRSTFEKLVAAEPEPLRSRFDVTHSMVLNVAHRPGDARAAMDHLLTDNDEPPEARAALVDRAAAITESLVAAGVLEVLDPPGPDGRTWRIVDELQVDFALNQRLSTFALAAIELLDRESPTYAVDVLSILEATLEDPRPVLYAQRFRARGEEVAAMKAEGIEYEERMELLEDVSWPTPLADMLEAAYDIYAEGHPWVTEYPLRPKAVARELHELAMTFVEYVGYHRLASSEGLVLRYLADAYKALRRTVPEEARTEELADLTEWLGELVRQVDSSLLDEWEQLLHPRADGPAPDRSAVDAGPPPVTANVRAFRVLVRNAMFRRVELAALRRWEELGELDGEAGYDAARWAAAMEPYFAMHDEVGTGPSSRGPLLIQIEAEPGQWKVRQVLDDPAGDHDWGIRAEVDLAASDLQGAAVVRVLEVGCW
jgi:superfamily II RNA helicase